MITGLKRDLLIAVVGLRHHDITGADCVDWVMSNRDDDPSRSYLYELLRDLEDDGLVDREERDDDRRANGYKPTSEGIDKLTELRDQIDRALDGFEPVEEVVESMDTSSKDYSPVSNDETRAARAVGVAKDLRNHLAATDGPITAQTALAETEITEQLLAEALKARSEWFEIDGDMIRLSLRGREEAEADPFAEWSA